MPDILLFSRNRFSGVEMLDDRQMRAFCILNDTFLQSTAEIIVQLPHLEIISINATISKAPGNKNEYKPDTFSEITGMRIGPGMRRIISEFTSKLEYGDKLALMIDECCNSVILTFTKRELLKAPKGLKDEKIFFKKMVKDNPRLLNSCAALSEGSPLLRDIVDDTLQQGDKR